MGKFQVHVWCEACRGDPEGCFGGASHPMPGWFPTSEQAEFAARRYCGSLPYGYRVEPVGEWAGDFASPEVDTLPFGLPVQ